VTLILFDIDGTLTRTNHVDAHCYALAFQEVFGIPLPTTDWNHYTHVTDTGIIHEVMESARGFQATQDELDAFERAFVRHLEAVFEVDAPAFNEIPGAADVLRSIAARDGLAAALATGGMRASATYKLSRIGVNAGTLPGGFANDSIPSQGIVRCAVRRMLGRGKDTNPADDGRIPDMVYVGDGAWDVKTAGSLGMRFIGITGDAHADRLYGCGAKVCLPDYSDQEAFFRAVREAAVPDGYGPGDFDNA